VSVSADVFANGTPDAGKAVTFEAGDPTVISIVQNGRTAQVNALKAGSTVLTAKATHDGQNIYSSVPVTVVRASVTLNNYFCLDRSEDEIELNLSAAGILGDIEGVYLSSTLISNAGSAEILREWRDSRIAYDVQNITIRTAKVSYNAKLYIKEDLRLRRGDSDELSRYAGDETALDFREGTYVYEHNTGSMTEWNSRISISNLDCALFDYFGFEFVLATPIPAGSLIFIWSNIPSTTINNTGAHSGEVKVVITDAAGNVITGALQAGVRYKIAAEVIKIGGSTIYAVSFNAPAFKVYIAKAFCGYGLI